MKAYKLLSLFFFLIIFSSGSYAQTVTVTGTVTSNEDQEPLPGVSVIIKGTSTGTSTNIDGEYSIEVGEHDEVLVFSYIGFLTQEVEIKDQTVINAELAVDLESLEEVVVIGYGTRRKISLSGSVAGIGNRRRNNRKSKHIKYQQWSPPASSEAYNTINENRFEGVDGKPRSTFSIDVDKAGYANVRRMINDGQRPPKDAVKIEEMINYFDYKYIAPQEGDPFSINSELANCPWNAAHQLLHIGLKGKEIPKDDRPRSNLVFLLDVSGSMNSANKLPLLKKSLKLLIDQLDKRDRIAIVVYAGAAGVVLRSTPVSKKEEIITALENLEAGGSTAGGAGIELAYSIAQKNFMENGNNRVVLATDGDFNVGPSNTNSLKSLIAKKRESGVFLTCLGFGMGNYRDDMLEALAQKGNGNHAYIDTMQEAFRVLGKEFMGTMFSIAKDVKIQIEFNPANVQAYRLIGYENRLLEDEDFKDDKKDAGELGAGHTVTALYEIVPVGVKSKFIKDIPKLKYQKQELTDLSGEIATVKLRYKPIKSSKSIKLEAVIDYGKQEWENASDNFRFSASVALFGMLLRESEFSKNADFSLVTKMAKEAKGEDEDGYRAEFIRLVRSMEAL